MSVRVRMAPSPTGFLHIGGVRTFLFNWLFARRHERRVLLRIENTDTSREVAEAVDQIKDSLIWLGIDWDGDVTFQLDTAGKARELAEQLLSEGKAYEDDGAIRFRQPKEGTVSWDDAVRGRIEFKNELLNDLVIVRSDGRPTYNFVSPIDDVYDEITHVIRGEDHVSNTPTQINILRALGATLPVYAHVPNINGDDGRKLSKRRNAVALDDFRAAGYLPAALLNFLALLGWSYDDKTTIMARHELDRAFLARARRAEPGDVRLQEARLDERHLPARPAAGGVRAFPQQWLHEQGIAWPEVTVNATVPLVQEKIETFSQYPDFVRFLFEEVSTEGADPAICAAAPAARADRAVGVDDARGGSARACGRARREAAQCVRADPARDHRLEHLTGALREPRAAGARPVAGASTGR